MRIQIFAAAVVSLMIMGAAMLVFCSPAEAAGKDFKAWLHALKSEAAGRGISSATIERALPDSMTPIQHVLELDREQPEGAGSLERYLRNIVTADRVRQGRDKMGFYSRVLGQVETTYGVDRQSIVALWGLETSYGENTGGYEVVPALATLAFDGRRGEFFRDELFKALKILDEGDVKPSGMKGSWAGAMGQNQFMPSSYLKFAVDFDKDGKRDIWNSRADVFASTANYLASSGWKRGEPWGRRVRLPAKIDRSVLGADRSYSLQFWHDHGLRMFDGKSIPFEGEYQASVIQPDGPGGQAFIVYDNYRVFLKWNKSTYFAVSAGLLSDKLKGAEHVQAASR